MSLALIMPGCGSESEEPVVRTGASALTLDDDTGSVPRNAKGPNPDTDTDSSPTKGKGGKDGKGSGGSKSPKKELPTKPIVPVQSTCGEDPNFASNDVGQFDVDQWIGLKGDLEACADFVSPEWDVKPLFPANLVPGATIPAGLRNYCVATPVVPSTVPDPVQAVFKLSDLARDRLVFPTESALSAGVFPDMRDRFLGGTGYLAAPDDHLSTSPTVPVDLFVLDTQPTIAPATPRSPHGVSLTGMAEELACGQQVGCSRVVRSQLAMSRFYAGLSDDEYDPTTPLTTYEDPIRGGNFGTQGELAVAVVRTMLEHQVLRKLTQGGQARRAVLNMSLGWDPALFGDMPSSVYADAAAQLSLLTSTGPSGVTGPVRAVHAALASATCDGALLLASTGNEVPGVCDAGPLLPAGFNTLERLSSTQCEQAGLRGISEVPGYPYAQPTKALQPLVYGVGATDWDQEVATFQRDDAVPLLNALGFKGAAFTDTTGTRSGILTGTSVSSVVAAASLATAWSHAPELSSDAIVGAVAFNAPTFNTQGGVVQALADYGVDQASGTAMPARVLTVCGALDAVASLQGLSPLGVCPSSAGLMNPDVDALIDATVVASSLTVQSATSAPLKPAKCTNACGEPYLYRETTVADWQTGPLLQGNFISPQPHSNLCPACNINGGGTGGGSAAGGTGSVSLAIDEAYVQLTPGNVTIIRSGAGTSVIVGLGNVFDGLDPSEPLTVLSTALVDDPSLELEDATVVVEFTDPASGLTFNAYDSITVTE